MPGLPPIHHNNSFPPTAEYQNGTSQTQVYHVFEMSDDNVSSKEEMLFDNFDNIDRVEEVASDLFLQQAGKVFAPHKPPVNLHSYQSNQSEDTVQYVINKNTQAYVARNKIFKVKEEIGRGSFAKVFSAEEFSTVRDTPPKRKAIKVTGDSFGPEKLLNSLMSPASKGRETLCLALETFVLVNRYSINSNVGVYEECKNDFSKENFEVLANPISHALKLLADFADGVAIMHRLRLRHGDLKAQNLLVKKNGGGAAGDFGTAKLIPDVSERTTVTVNERTLVTLRYAMEDIWRSIEEQLNRIGFQGEEADVFAFGCTIWFDVILKCFNHLKQSYVNTNEIQAIFEKFKVEEMSMSAPVDLKILQELKDKNPGKRFIVAPYIGEIKVMIFPPREQIRDASLEFLKLVADKFSPLEIKKWEELIKLRYELENSDPAQLPSMEMVKNSLNRISDLTLIDGQQSPVRRKLYYPVKETPVKPVNETPVKRKLDFPSLAVDKKQRRELENSVRTKFPSIETVKNSMNEINRVKRRLDFDLEPTSNKKAKK